MNENAGPNSNMLEETEVERRRIAEKIGYITADQLGQLAKVSPATIEDWRKRGKGPVCSLLGNAFLYELSDVMEYLNSRKKTRNRNPMLKAL